MPSSFLYLLVILLTTLPSTYYIYNYPRIHGCAWQNPDAPFRLMAFADPQIEGEEKRKYLRGRIDLWGNDRYLAHVHRSMILQIKPEATHEVVLGDLFGSQWIKDEEFASRVHRYKNIIFKDVQKPRRSVTTLDNFDSGNHDVGYAGELSIERLSRWENAFGNASHLHTLQIPDLPPLRIILYNTLNLDSPATDRSLQQSTYAFLHSLLPESDDVPIPQSILLTHLPLYRTVCSDLPRFEYWSLDVTNDQGNVTGCFRPIKHQNHLSRWASDWILDAIFGDADEGVILGGHDHTGCDVLHRKVVLHPTVEDADVVHDELRRRDEFKPEEWDEEFDQNEEAPGNEAEAHDEVFGDQDVPRGNIIEPALEENFDQSDKQEANITHSEVEDWEIAQNESHIRNNQTHGAWLAEKFRPGRSGIREITVRSMMGDFHGNVGLLTASYNHDAQCTALLPLISTIFVVTLIFGVWEFDYSSCLFLVQHWWWAVHIWDGICIACVAGYLARPLWWRHWRRRGRPALEWGLKRTMKSVEIILDRWGFLSRGRRLQDTEQGVRKKL